MGHWSNEIGTGEIGAGRCESHQRDLLGGPIPKGSPSGVQGHASMPLSMVKCELEQTGGRQGCRKTVRCDEGLTVAGRTCGP